jgi:TonB dependent receptor
VDFRTPGLGTTRATPVGPVPSTANLNADYAPRNWRGWGVSAEWTRLSSRLETDNGLFQLPPLATLNAGVRFTRKCLDHPCTLRLDVANLANASGLLISPQYGVLSQVGRNYMLTAAIDL